MKKAKPVFFEPGQKAGHEGVTELQAKGGLCAGRASNKRGEPCMCPRGWACVDVIGSSNIIFKKA